MIILYKFTDPFCRYFLTDCFTNIAIEIFNYFAHSVFRKEDGKSDGFRWLFVLTLLMGYIWIFIAIYNKWFEGIGPKCLSSDMLLYYLPFFGFSMAILVPYIKKR